MFMDISHFLTTAQPFVETFNAWAAISSPQAKADHICFRCSSNSEFEQVRSLFEHESSFIYQSIISKRRIAVIKFNQPIKTILGEIWYLELSDQKPDGSQKNGFEHIEIYPTESSVDAFAAVLEQKGTRFEKVIRPHHTTYDAVMSGTFKVKLEDGALIDKIKRDEML